jgi:hypothetical protein
MVTLLILSISIFGPLAIGRLFGLEAGVINCVFVLVVFALASYDQYHDTQMTGYLLLLSTVIFIGFGHRISEFMLNFGYVLLLPTSLAFLFV